MTSPTKGQTAMAYPEALADCPRCGARAGLFHRQGCEGPVEPRPVLASALAGIGGIGIAIAGQFWASFQMPKTVENINRFRADVGLPPLGSICPPLVPPATKPCNPHIARALAQPPDGPLLGCRRWEAGR